MEEVQPPKDIKNRIALVDADTLLYRVAIALQREELIVAEAYSKEELVEIYADINYDEELEVLYSLDLDLALEKVRHEINTILNDTTCLDFELHFTSGKNFRYKIDRNYKNNRKGRTPAYLNDLKQVVAEYYSAKAYIHTEIEADDMVVALATKYPTKYLVVAVDKDILKNVVGTHYNYYRSYIHNIEPHFIVTTKDEAMKYPYVQVLQGDTSDGIKGIPRIGKVTVKKLLDECTTELECKEAVLNIAKEKNHSLFRLLRDYRLVSMHQIELENDRSYTIKLKGFR